jgi:hypothetical protein
MMQRNSYPRFAMAKPFHAKRQNTSASAQVAAPGWRNTQKWQQSCAVFQVCNRWRKKKYHAGRKYNELSLTGGGKDGTQ